MKGPTNYNFDDTALGREFIKAYGLPGLSDAEIRLNRPGTVGCVGMPVPR